MRVGFMTIMVAVAVCGSPLTIYTLPSDQYCLAEDDMPYVQFSTKTSYQVARNRKSAAHVPNCKAEAAWALIRHGTRYPNEKSDAKLQELKNTVVAVIENHEIRHNGELCREDLDTLKSWSYKYTPNDLGQLADEGRADLRILAGGYKLSLPEIFTNATPEKTIVKFTYVKRTRDSAEAFLSGLNKNVDWNLSDNNIDDLLMLNTTCIQWEKSRKTEEAVRERNAFAESADMKTAIHRISTRLGFKYNLDFKTVMTIYEMCRSEKAVYYQRNPVSAWCAAFTKADLETIEYYLDLSYYYESGYGNPMTMKLGCPITRDLLLKFENITKNNGTFDVNPLTLYFAHSLTLRSVITKLGLARDSTAPKHDNRGLPSVQNRQWRTSRLSPFTGNLAAVLYRCTTGEEWKIMFYLNEHLVYYEGCNLGLCDWSYIIDRFRDHIDPETCNYDLCFALSSVPSLNPSFAIVTLVSLRLIIWRLL